MIKYLLFIFILMNPLVAYTADETEDEMQPLIGSIDDSGRVDPEEFKFSHAENILWMDKHLLNIEQPARLYYEFEKSGTYEDGFIDDVFLDIININEDGSRNTVLNFLSDEKRQKVSPSNVVNITGNPVIGVYLQGDVYEMNRLTEGHWKYFHKQVKLAIADSNESEAVTIELGGKQYAGEKITLHPYDNVAKKERLKEFADKSYEFILSDQIPGKLYQIKTVINDPANPDIPLIVEKLTLKNVEFRPKVVANKQD